MCGKKKFCINAVCISIGNDNTNAPTPAITNTTSNTSATNTIANTTLTNTTIVLSPTTNTTNITSTTTKTPTTITIIPTRTPTKAPSKVTEIPTKKPTKMPTKVPTVATEQPATTSVKESGGFEFPGCNGGKGSFERDMPTAGAYVTIGEIPTDQVRVCLLSAVCRLMSAVCCLLSAVWYFSPAPLRLSLTSRFLSGFPQYLPGVLF
jgi:hypothetical protein